MAHKTLNRFFAVLTFLLGMAVYLKTVAPTVSFWDCGEFIACAFKLQIPHPPGAPIYLLVGRIAEWGDYFYLTLYRRHSGEEITTPIVGND